MTIKHGFTFLLLLTIDFSISSAQDLNYTHRVIDTLTSPSMHGRGYVQNGDKIAANYLKGEFQKLNIQAVDDNYFQYFKFPVNTFPKDVKVAVDGTALKPGVDFIVSANSSKAKGTFDLHWLISANLRGSLDVIKDKFIVVDKTRMINKDEQKAMDLWINDPHGAKGVVVIEESKLTWSVARKKYKYPVIHILKKAIQPEAKNITLKIDEKFYKNYKTQNVAGFINGSVKPDSFIVFTAHYDHLGMMGRDTYFPGANDNASGVSMLLNFVKYYAANKPKYSILFIAFAGEEAGLMGSEYYVKHPLVALSKIKFLINMDLLGTGDDGLMVVNGDVYKDQFVLMENINTEKQYVKSLQKRGRAKNSDHYWFSENGVPCFFIYTLGGIAAYHDIYDRAETLPLSDYEDVFKLVKDFVSELP